MSGLPSMCAKISQNVRSSTEGAEVVNSGSSVILTSELMTVYSCSLMSTKTPRLLKIDLPVSSNCFLHQFDDEAVKSCLPGRH